MIGTCAAGGYGDIASLMAAVDCHVGAYVAAAYEGLFGKSGQLTAALVGGLTIYVALYGYRLIMGAGATVPDLVRRFIAMGFVIALSSNWPAYQTVFVNTVVGGAEEIARLMSAAAGGGRATSETVAEALDVVVGDITDLAATWGRATPQGTQTVASQSNEAQGAATAPAAPPPAPAPGQAAPASAVNMLWISAILLGVSSVGVIIITKITLGFLLALGPLFILFGLFRTTRGLFEGWLRTIVGGAFVLSFTLLATAGALAILAPMTEEIIQKQRLGDNSVGPVFALTIAVIVFSMLIRQVLASTTRLVGAWRLPGRAHEDARPESTIAPSPAPAQAAGDARIIDIVSSVSRSDADTTQTPPRTAIAAPGSGAAGFEDRGSNDGDIRRAARAYRGFGSARLRTARGLP